MTSRRLRGFTLVEFLVASVLAGVLTVTLLLVLASIGRDRSLIGHRADSAVLHRRLVRLIRDDLRAATALRQEPEGVTLLGHGGLAATTLRPSQRVAAVSYRIARAGGRRWLLRQQQNLDGSGDGGRWSELVCTGIRSIELKAMDWRADKAEVMPAQVRLIVQWEDGKQPPVDELIILRGPRP